ncbi:unnamed protein product [Notodromas monacha]|uniref:Uncharacterized protein n=1 Tax=Notodromas monacha TaxID=399045 RepID=A0A7R9BD84_9CRUS|nr:unnamed protein product [Notodromas monacha]CAG0912613.1 unnamed protein product [Notodromas monacha]
MASWSKVTVKTLDQNTYEVDASGLKTVSEFKAKLETILGPDTIPADSMRIINNGQIMSDDNALLGDLKVDLKKPFLVMMTRAKTAPVSALPPVPNAEKSPMTRSEPLGQRSHLIQGQVTTSGNSVSEPTYSRSTERQRESYIRAFKVMQQGSSGIRDNSDTSVSVTGQGTTSQPDTSVEASVDNADPPLIVQALMAMGFDRAPVESALRMTEGDPDRALELLLNGALFMDDTTALGDLLSLHPPDAAFLQLVQEPYMNTLRERVQREGPDVLTDALRIVALQNTQAIEIIHANQDIFVDWLNGMDPSHTPQVKLASDSQLKCVIERTANNIMATNTAPDRNARLQQTQAQVDEVVGIMRVNVEKVLERDAKLSELDKSADELQQGAQQFTQTAKSLKRKYWWKNAKVSLNSLRLFCQIV